MEQHTLTTKLTCERCAAPHEITDSHSMLVVLQKVDKSGYTFFQCESGQEYQYMTYQHYGCSPACMAALVKQCLAEHHIEEKLHPILPGAGSTILHRIVLGRGYTCQQCHAPLDVVAYRFLLTRATPFNELPHSHHELAEWCCSLAHAQQRAAQVLEGYLGQQAG